MMHARLILSICLAEELPALSDFMLAYAHLNELQKGAEH